MTRVEDIVDEARCYLSEADIDLIRRSYGFSAEAHREQVRSSGEPYLVHPLEVARILVHMRLDAAAIATGLLHDVLEDTLTTAATLSELFGGDIAHMVEGVTKISKIRFSSREAEQAENFRKMVLAMVDDVRVILVKLADRLHNMRTLEFLPLEKRQRIARETLDIYAPLANRLGIGRIKGELEDLAFQFLWPAECAELESKIQDRQSSSQGFIEAVQARLVDTCRGHGIDAEVDGRVKRMYSIWQKMQRQQIQLEEVYDYIAFRVLTSSVKDCYAVLGAVHGVWTPIPGRIKDYIAMPKPNLYQSLHTTLMSDQGQAFEVQIRTTEMHRIAEEGIAAHWLYKDDPGANRGDGRAFAWLRSLVELGKDVQDPREFLDSLKIDLYPDEVHAFTPKGKVLSFPRGSTAIDFAYGIHTEVGHQCVGARINGKLVPLRTALHNGDIVEVLTDRTHRPSRDWLKTVVTSRARTKIRQWLKNEERLRAVELGRALLDRELKKAHVRGRPDESELAPILTGLGLGKVDDLHAALAYGRVEARQVALKLAGGGREETTPSKPERETRRPTSETGSGIEVKGHGDILVGLARCCRPIRGDGIVGYITRGRGVTVHATTCKNVVNLFYDAERKIDVAWAGEPSPLKYEVGVRLITEDRPGILAKVSSKIAGENANIKHVAAKTFEDKKGLINLTIEIADLKQLEDVCRLLAQVDGVIRVSRI